MNPAQLLLEVGKELSPTKVGVFAFARRYGHRKRLSVVGPDIGTKGKVWMSRHGPPTYILVASFAALSICLKLDQVVCNGG